jgi:beta-galactosidase
MPQAFITHNGYFQNVDYGKLKEECLDILSFDSYPAFQEKNVKNSGRNLAYRLARTREFSEKFFILEQQAGPGGQLSCLLPTPRPGQIRLWTYQSIAYGAVGILYFRYRTALFGAEQLWYGIYDHDGEENYRSREVREIAAEIGRIGHIFLNERKRTDVAIYGNYHNECADKAESFAENDSREIFMELNKHNIHADLIHSAEEFKKYKVLILPHVTIADEKLADAVSRFAESGGIAIISARSGVKDKNANYRPTKPPCVFRDIAGCRVDWFTAAANYDRQYVTYKGKNYLAENYFEMLTPENSEVVGEYTEGFLSGKPAITKCGNIYYVGFYSRASADLYLDIISEYIEIPAMIDPDLEVIELQRHTVYLNHSDRFIPLSIYDIIGNKELDTIPPYGVAVAEKCADSDY